MADQKVPTTPAELAKDNNKAEQAAAEQDEAEEKDPATLWREWRDRIIASEEWKNLNGPELNEWAEKQAKKLISITKDVLETRQPAQQKDPTVKKPEQPINDPEYEERKKKCLAEIQEIWKKEESFKPKRREDQAEFKLDKGSHLYKGIMDEKREHLKNSDKDRCEKIK